MLFKEILIDMIYVGEGVVRTRKIEEDLDKLAESIKRLGLLNPVVVFPKGDKYELVIGQRRLLACEKLGWKKIPAMVIGPLDVATAKILWTTEHVQRKELSRTDMVDAVRYLYQNFGSVKAVAEELGVSYTLVRRYLRYEALPKELKKMVDETIISLSDAIKATDAATLPDGKVDIKKAVKIAEGIKDLTIAQRRALVEVAKDRPTASVEELLGEAQKPPVEVRMAVHLTSRYTKILKKVADDLGIEFEDVLITALSEWLTLKGYL